MADTDTPGITPRRNWPRRLLISLGGFVGLLVVAVLGVYIWLNTASGRAFVAQQLRAMTFANGLKIEVGRIDGSIFGRMDIHDLALRDPRGRFFAAPDVTLDWRPLTYLGKHIDIRTLAVPTAHLYRSPQFKPTPPSKGPLLPDLDIDLDQLAVGRMQIDPPITGKRHLVALSGSVHIAGGRAQVKADGRALTAPGVAGGDRLALTFDAVPKANKLNIDIKLNAPADGLVAALSGIDQPTMLALAGTGNWAKWSGKLVGATGKTQLANVAITERDGTFTLRGPIRPGLFLTGVGHNMLEPVTRLDISAYAQQRRIQLDAHIASDSFTLAAKGRVDLARNQFSQFMIDFRLFKPSIITTNLHGDDVLAQATLNGSFTSPDVTYKLVARRLGFGATQVDDLAISGSAGQQDGQWRLPLHGQARQISGVAGNISPLLHNVRLDGTFAYANGKLLSDDLRLRSSGIDAKAVVLAEPGSGVYTGTLNGRINGYQVESVGKFNLQTALDLKSGANNSVRLSGHVAARSTRLTNTSMRNFLGGNVLIAANVGYDSNGVATIDKLNVAAPDFRLTGGHGRYGADGSVQFAANGKSTQYGGLALDVRGSVARPVVRLKAEHPGLGVGLAGLDATVRGKDGTYLVKASGRTDYGPMQADVAVTAGKGPMRIAVHRGTRFAGVDFIGEIAQSRAGPFAGTLSASGSGIIGHVRLSDYSGKQRAQIDATANKTKLPGHAGLSVRRAIVKADVILYDQPQVAANVELAGLHAGTLDIAAARVQANMRGGTGQAKLLVEGRRKFPFRIAGNVQMAPKLWRIALDGRVNGIDIKTQGPLQIVPDQGKYRLEASTLSVGKGTLQLAGQYGPGLIVHGRLKNVALSLTDPFVQGLGLGGTATGSLDFQQPTATAFPTADARLKIDNFTRTSIAAVSQPVDIALVGQLKADGGHASALVSRRGASVGRMLVNLKPLPPGAGSWVTRLLAAPLSGGVRYNGPADALFSLAALPDQSLSGAIGVAADFGGHVQTPTLTGVVRANNLTYNNGQYGTQLTNMQVQGRFTNDRLNVEKLTAQAGDGTVSASGYVSLSAREGFPIQLGLDLDKAQLATGQALAAKASGKIKIVNGPQQPPTISGQITLPETHYQIVRQASAQVPTLTGVHRKPVETRERITGSPEPMTSIPSTWRLNVDVTAQNKIYVTGMGINSEWAADLHVAGTSGAPAITGKVTLVRGTLGFAGHSFDLQQGRIQFEGGNMTDPQINIVATSDIEDVSMTITITGSAQNPQIALSSTPNLPQDELMARVLFGNSVGQLSAIQAVQLAASLNSLRGSGGGLNPLGVLQSASGIDRIRILGANKKTGQGTSLAVGQYITNDVYVEIVTDTRGYTATQLEVSLTRALSILSQASSFGTSNLNLQYKKNY